MKKKLTMLAGLVALTAGCHSMSYTTENGETFKAKSFIQTLNVGKIERGGDGSIVVENYGRGGDTELIQSITEGAVQGAMRSLP